MTCSFILIFRFIGPLKKISAIPLSGWKINRARDDMTGTG
ncbi:hypothetical protein DDI_2906 [Dickeya dianthicola RNS04.9]|nr:hypothetical protein DDI_2906 [Dickeya dianthicola RNS04.9]